MAFIFAGTFFHRLAVMRDDPMSYNFSAGRSEGTAILKLEGPLTLSTMFALQDELRKATPQVLILDLTGTPYMDSAGLGLLMNYYVSAQAHGRKLLLAGVNERVSSLLEMTKVQAILKSFATVDDAEASL